MDPIIQYLLATLVGGAMAFFSAYMLEARRLKNEQYKFKLEKMINVGEDFYRFSAYTIMRFETLIDNYKTHSQYKTEFARGILIQTEKNLHDVIKAVAESYVTITTADIFFGVSGINEANAVMLNVKHAEASYAEKISNEDILEEVEKAHNLRIKALQHAVDTINADRAKIKTRLNELLDLQRKKK